MVRIGLIGIGRMGRILARQLAGHVELCLFDRDAKKMNLLAEELNISTANNLEDIVKMEKVILAVPDHEVVSCIKVFNQMKEPLTVINIATNVAQHMLERMAAPHVKCICVKFIGHADEMALGERPVIIVNQFPADIVPQLVEVFQVVGQVVVGRADLVHTINTLAAERAIEAAVGIEEALKQKSITDEVLIKSAIRQVAAGILKAYADGNMGPFAREIVQSVKSKIHRN